MFDAYRSIDFNNALIAESLYSYKTLVSAKNL